MGGGNLLPEVGGHGATKVAIIDESTGESLDIVGGALGVAVTPLYVGTSTPANVNSSATAVTLSAANASRIGWTVFNDSTQVLYVKFGAAASATDYKVKILAGGYYEMPSPIYRGIITGIWASANGAARVVEDI